MSPKHGYYVNQGQFWGFQRKVKFFQTRKSLAFQKNFLPGLACQIFAAPVICRVISPEKKHLKCFFTLQNDIIEQFFMFFPSQSCFQI